MHLFTPFLAADYAIERRREADHRRLEALVKGTVHGISPVRRIAAQVLVAISRSSASAVRRLDACLADDLGRALAPTDGV